MVKLNTLTGVCLCNIHHISCLSYQIGSSHLLPNVGPLQVFHQPMRKAVMVTFV